MSKNGNIYDDGSRAVYVVDIDSVRDHPMNNMIHTDMQINKLMKLIKKHNQLGSVTISSDNFLLKGHGVRRACKALGHKELLVLEYKDVKHDDQAALEYLASDNRIAMDSEIQIDKTIEIINKLSDDFGLDFEEIAEGTAFELFEIDDLLLDHNFNENVDLKDKDDIPQDDEEDDEEGGNYASGVYIQCPECGEEFYHKFQDYRQANQTEDDNDD